MEQIKAITNAKIVTVTQGTLERGTIVFSDKILEVGENVNVPEGAEVINGEGFWVTPGLIDCHTHISTFYEPRNMPSLGTDANECSDPITPHVRAVDALNPFDPAIEKTRKSGFTTVYTGPGSGNLIGGTGISFKLRGTTAEEMIIPGTEQMKMALGENPKRAFGMDKKMPITRMGSAALIRQTLYEARNYADKLEKAKTDPTKAPEPNFKLDSLVRVVRGEQRVRIHSHRSDDIRTAIRIAEEYKLDFSIEHATEGYLIKDFLAERNVTCVVGPLLLEPVKQEVWGLILENAGILTEAGVKVCLTADTGSKTAWLPIEVGLLIRRGLSEEAAFKGVTINPAELLGIADKVGSIEVGKDADLAVFDGHPFSNLSLCRATIIDGKLEYNALQAKA